MNLDGQGNVVVGDAFEQRLERDPPLESGQGGAQRAKVTSA